MLKLFLQVVCKRSSTGQCQTDLKERMMNSQNWQTAVESLKNARNVVVCSGAGISAESGIPTFRDSDGFWTKFPPKLFANWDGLMRIAQTDPKSLAMFMKHLIEPIANAEPNAAHLAVAELEEQFTTTIITQNVDGLHQSAGSTNVLEIHGSLLEIVDANSKQIVKLMERNELKPIVDILNKYISTESTLENSISNFLNYLPLNWIEQHRPNLVLFGDSLAMPAWDDANKAARACDVFLCIGTSRTVMPAAMLPSLAKASGAIVISVDPKQSPGCWLQGNATEILPELVKAIGKK